MDQYPAMDSLSDGDRLKCQFAGCRSSYAKFKSLLEHIKGKHGVTHEQLKHHWVHTLAIHERNPKSLSHEESTLVSLVYNEDGSVDEEQAES